MAERAAHGGVLIETASGCAGHVVLGLDGRIDQGHAAGIGGSIAQTVHVIERQCGGAGHGGRGAQARAQRHARREGGVKALHRIEAGFSQCPGHAYRIGGPSFHAAGGQAIEVRFGDGIRRHVGNHAYLRVFARLQCDEGAMRQRDRQAQARVIVGMLADQVHTARGCPYAGRLLSVDGLEQIDGDLHALVVRERLNEFNISHWCVLMLVLVPVSLRCQSGRARGSAWR